MSTDDVRSHRIRNLALAFVAVAAIVPSTAHADDGVEYACIREYSFTRESRYTASCTPYDPSSDRRVTCAYAIHTGVPSEHRRVLSTSRTPTAACLGTELVAARHKEDGLGGMLPDYQPDFMNWMPSEVRAVFQFVWEVGCWKRESTTAPWTPIPLEECRPWGIGGY